MSHDYHDFTLSISKHVLSLPLWIMYYTAKLIIDTSSGFNRLGAVSLTSGVNVINNAVTIYFVILNLHAISVMIYRYAFQHVILLKLHYGC